jgi:hypothetical protein
MLTVPSSSSFFTLLPHALSPEVSCQSILSWFFTTLASFASKFSTYELSPISHFTLHFLLTRPYFVLTPDLNFTLTFTPYSALITILSPPACVVLLASHPQTHKNALVFFLRSFSICHPAFIPHVLSFLRLLLHPISSSRLLFIHIKPLASLLRMLVITSSFLVYICTCSIHWSPHSLMTTIHLLLLRSWPLTSFIASFSPLHLPIRLFFDLYLHTVWSSLRSIVLTHCCYVLLDFYLSLTTAFVPLQKGQAKPPHSSRCWWPGLHSFFSPAPPPHPPL